MQRREVYYSGCVQGVGFRYTTRSVAMNYDVRGFVRNLGDGRVQLVAEGDVMELEQFLVAVAQAMAGNIDDVELTDATATGEFESFEIR